MRTYLTLSFLVLTGIYASAETQELKSLERCITQMESDIDYYRSFFPAIAWRLDPNLHHLLQAYPVFKKNETLLRRNFTQNNETSKPSVHLLNNATESCVHSSKAFRRRVRSFMQLVFLAPITVFFAILYLVLVVPWNRLTDLSKSKLGALLFALLLGFQNTAAGEPLTVYTYASFLGKGSIGEYVKEKFEKRTGLQLRYVSFGSAAEALNQIVIEGASTPAEVLVGIDNGLLTRAKESKHFLSLPVEITQSLKEEVLYDPDRQFIPYDFGYLAFVYDQERIKGSGVSAKAQSLKEFISQKKLSKKIVIEDPRTSSIGLGFLVWTRSLFPVEAEWVDFWKSLSSKLLTIAPGWSAAYGLFLKKEVDWVLSYTTSPAYHIEKENKKSISALALTDPLYAQVEGAGVVRFTQRPKVAQQFIEVLLSSEVQNAIPLKQWMYPALKGVKLPKSFPTLTAKHSAPSFSMPTEIERKELLKKWEALYTNPK